MTDPDVATVRQLVQASDEPDPARSTASMLAALTGCRRGELLGMRWSDVDRDEMALRVERAGTREEDGRQLRVGPTKTHQDRGVSLDPVAFAALDTHRQHAQRWAANAGVMLADDGYVLTEDPQQAPRTRGAGSTGRASGRRRRCRR